MMMGRTARWRGTAAALATAAGLAVACGPPPSVGEGANANLTAADLPPCPLGALEKASKPVKIVIWHGLGVQPKRALDDLVAKFNKSQKEVQVTAQVQGKSYEEVLRKYEAAAAAGSTLPAIAYLEDATLGSLVGKGTLFPAESCMRADGFDLGTVQPAARSYYTVNDVFWPGYINVSEPVLYINRAHYRRAKLDPDKPPRTLAELRTQAVALKKAGIKFPLVLKLDEWYFETWLNAVGADVINNDNGRSGTPTKGNLASEQAVELVEFLQGMKKDGLMTPLSDSDGQVRQYLAMASQDSSMTVETSTAATSIKAFLQGNLDAGGADTGGADASGVDKGGLDVAAVPLPGIEEPGQVRVSGAAFFMTDRVPDVQKAAAWKFLSFMLQPENVVSWHLVGSYLPVVGDAADDPRVQEFWKNDIAGRMLKVSYDQLAAIDPKRPGPLLGVYPAYSDAVRKALDGSLLSDQDARAGLEKANAELDAALTDFNR